MEKQSIEKTIVEKRGLLYFLGKIIIFPFRVLYWIGKLCYKYLSIYFSWVRYSNTVRKKKKLLNSYMAINRSEEEIL